MRIVPGEDLFGSALQWARENPVALHKEHQEVVSKGFVRFINFCIGMCMALGTSKIKLPCREVADALHVNKETVSSYRQRGVELGYLTLLKAHSYSPNGKGEATLFKFHIEKWGEIAKKVKAKARPKQ
jgi:hypothetical protein